MWLLSCSEVYSDGYQEGAFGLCAGAEGSQYQFYRQGQQGFNNGVVTARKPNQDSGEPWWLRSVSYAARNYYNHVKASGSCGTADFNQKTYGIAPGFAI